MLHRDRAERRERLGLSAASARSGTGASARAPTRLRRAARACPRSRSTRRAGRGRARDPPGAASAISRRQAGRAALPASAASSATAARVTERVRRLQVDEVRDREQRRVEALAGEHDRERGLGLRSPHPRSRPSRGRARIIVRVGAQQRRRASGSNCLPPRLRASAVAASTPPTRCATSTNSASCASRDAIGTSLACELAGPAAPVPLLVRRADRLEHRRRQPELLGERPRERRRAGRSCRRPRGDRRSRTRARAGSGAAAGCPRPTSRIAASRRARCPGSWSYLPDLSAMSSPNHFACSCASE